MPDWQAPIFSAFSSFFYFGFVLDKVKWINGAKYKIESAISRWTGTVMSQLRF